MADFDRRELGDDKGVAMRAMLSGWQSNLWTALPGMITKFDPAKLTCEVQPTIKAKVLDKTGQTKDVELPLLVDCPVIFPSGGGFTLSFPVKAGDECLVIFASRCIDSWWQSGGVQVQAELRMHDLSDGFVLPGPRSLPNVPASVSITDVQLRNADATTHIGIKANGDVDVLAGAVVKIKAPTITLDGNVNVTGNVSVAGTSGGAASGSPLKVNDISLPGLPSYKLHNHKVLGGFTDVPFPGS